MSFQVRIPSKVEKKIKKNATREMLREGIVENELRKIKKNPFPHSSRKATKIGALTADYRWSFSYKGVSYRIGYYINKETKEIFIAGLKKREDLQKRYEF